MSKKDMQSFIPKRPLQDGDKLYDVKKRVNSFAIVIQWLLNESIDHRKVTIDSDTDWNDLKNYSIYHYISLDGPNAPEESQLGNKEGIVICTSAGLGDKFQIAYSGKGLGFRSLHSNWVYMGQSIPTDVDVSKLIDRETLNKILQNYYTKPQINKIDDDILSQIDWIKKNYVSNDTFSKWKQHLYNQLNVWLSTPVNNYLVHDINNTSGEVSIVSSASESTASLASYNASNVNWLSSSVNSQLSESGTYESYALSSSNYEVSTDSSESVEYSESELGSYLNGGWSYNDISESSLRSLVSLNYANTSALNAYTFDATHSDLSSVDVTTTNYPDIDFGGEVGHIAWPNPNGQQDITYANNSAAGLLKGVASNSSEAQNASADILTHPASIVEVTQNDYNSASNVGDGKTAYYPIYGDIGSYEGIRNAIGSEYLETNLDPAEVNIYAIPNSYELSNEDSESSLLTDDLSHAASLINNNEAAQYSFSSVNSLIYSSDNITSVVTTSGDTKNIFDLVGSDSPIAGVYSDNADYKYDYDSDANGFGGGITLVAGYKKISQNAPGATDCNNDSIQKVAENPLYIVATNGNQFTKFHLHDDGTGTNVTKTINKGTPIKKYITQNSDNIESLQVAWDNNFNGFNSQSQYNIYGNNLMASNTIDSNTGSIYANASNVSVAMRGLYQTSSSTYSTFTSLEGSNGFIWDNLNSYSYASPVNKYGHRRPAVITSSSISSASSVGPIYNNITAIRFLASADNTDQSLENNDYLNESASNFNNSNNIHNVSESANWGITLNKSSISSMQLNTFSQAASLYSYGYDTLDDAMWVSLMTGKSVQAPQIERSSLYYPDGSVYTNTSNINAIVNADNTINSQEINYLNDVSATASANSYHIASLQDGSNSSPNDFLSEYSATYSDGVFTGLVGNNPDPSSGSIYVNTDNINTLASAVGAQNSNYYSNSASVSNSISASASVVNSAIYSSFASAWTGINQNNTNLISAKSSILNSVTTAESNLNDNVSNAKNSLNNSFTSQMGGVTGRLDNDPFTNSSSGVLYNQLSSLNTSINSNPLIGYKSASESALANSIFTALGMDADKNGYIPTSWTPTNFNVPSLSFSAPSVNNKTISSAGMLKEFSQSSNGATFQLIVNNHNTIQAIMDNETITSGIQSGLNSDDFYVNSSADFSELSTINSNLSSNSFYQDSASNYTELSTIANDIGTDNLSLSNVYNYNYIPNPDAGTALSAFDNPINGPLENAASDIDPIVSAINTNYSSINSLMGNVSSLMSNLDGNNFYSNYYSMSNSVSNASSSASTALSKLSKDESELAISNNSATDSFIVVVGWNSQDIKSGYAGRILIFGSKTFTIGTQISPDMIFDYLINDSQYNPKNELTRGDYNDPHENGNKIGLFTLRNGQQFYYTNMGRSDIINGPYTYRYMVHAYKEGD